MKSQQSNNNGDYPSSVPRHIALIPDGNRRWARKRGFETFEGHKAGFENFLEFLKWCREAGVSTVSVFGFSTENWKRDEQERSYLFELFETGFREALERREELQEARIRVIGQKEHFPESLQRLLQDMEDRIGEGRFTLNLALSYGGRWDILQAVRGMIGDGKTKEEISEEMFRNYLSGSDIPDIDLLLRTSGEQRISNFLLWQLAYAELYFSPKNWPEFSKENFEEMVHDFAARKRRYGA